MPHITIKTYPDVTEAQKQELTKAIIDNIVSITGKNDAAISIDIIEVPQEEWMDKVYDIDIKPDIERLYKKPGY
ncbi:MAG: 4-oxalocrotonate tautomerase [Chryseobacterium sp.]|uniref:tautomerase family protein n=1 Tax=Pedobacter agri TaxID=454586 RepID=UPI00120E5C81|nr:tautomerase family protein [Pedobacter agri]MDQ1142912.1 4-oxalocrotonate tautomerase [Pedobacter agri]RZJ91137.1 MAG: 4-oxalocrotonate tautomerase [Chryseobacterium sp.]